jgi:diguanylate cyclase
MSQLQELARSVAGSPREALRRLLVLTCEQLAMDLVFLSALDGAGNRVIRMALQADGTPLPELEGRTEPVAVTWCGRVLDEDVLLVGDAGREPALLGLPVTESLRIASYAGVVLRDAGGRPIGTLCAVGHSPHESLNPRDSAALRGIGEVVAPLLGALDLPDLPLQRPAPDLSSLAETVAGSRDVEQLSRPLLDALHELTGLGSTYLTVIDEERDQQEVRFVTNTRPGFALPEGLRVPWSDTLCKRALDEDRSCNTEVPTSWGDSEAAAALGIEVYVSVPVRLSDGQLWGTLCGADSQQVAGVEQHLATMRLFAGLIAAQVEREEALAAERRRAHQARREADTDALTGCASRRVVEPWLAVNLADLEADEVLLVAFIDVDRFKAINDEHGHAAGDEVLAQIGARLRNVSRPGDVVARFGGDEFLLAARLPRTAADGLIRRVSAVRQVLLPWEGAVLQVTLSLGFALSDGHDAAELLAAADRAMYEVKRA